MLTFFKENENIYAVESSNPLQTSDINKLCWLFGNAGLLDDKIINGYFIGPRPTMITPWSTNAVEITINMGVSGITRIEKFLSTSQETGYDPMLLQVFGQLNQDIDVYKRQPFYYLPQDFFFYKKWSVSGFIINS